jgi:hypothetical protein
MSKTSDMLAQRLKEVEGELDSKRKALEKAQADLRGHAAVDAKRLELVAKVQEAKQPVISLTEEQGELARSISRLVGGTNHAPIPG